MDTTIVTCTTAGCPAAGIPHTVPADGLPVTCGGCATIIDMAA